MKPVILIVLDGVGHNENPKGNAVLAAHTPNLDAYKEKYQDKTNTKKSGFLYETVTKSLSARD